MHNLTTGFVLARNEYHRCILSAFKVSPLIQLLNERVRYIQFLPLDWVDDRIEYLLMSVSRAEAMHSAAHTEQSGDTTFNLKNRA